MRVGRKVGRVHLIFGRVGRFKIRGQLHFNYGVEVWDHAIMGHKKSIRISKLKMLAEDRTTS